MEGSASSTSTAGVGEKVGRACFAVGVALGAAVDGATVGVALVAAMEGSAVGDAVGDAVATAELQSLRSLAVMLHHSKRAKRNPCEPVC